MVEVLLAAAGAIILLAFAGDKTKAAVTSMGLIALCMLALAYSYSLYLRFPYRLGILDFVLFAAVFIVCDRFNRDRKKKRARVEHALAVVYGFSDIEDLYSNAGDATKLAFSAACTVNPREALEAAGIDVRWIENGGDPRRALEDTIHLREASDPLRLN